MRPSDDDHLAWIDHLVMRQRAASPTSQDCIDQARTAERLDARGSVAVLKIARAHGQLFGSPDDTDRTLKRDHTAATRGVVLNGA